MIAKKKDEMDKNQLIQAELPYHLILGAAKRIKTSLSEFEPKVLILCLSNSTYHQ